MQKIKLANGMELPWFGYGTFPQKEILEKNIPLAVECGYRLIDTSDNYYNERYIGLGLQHILEKTEKPVVISKFSQPYRTGELEKCFRESKEALNHQLSIYLLHWPYPFLWKIQWKKMEKLYFAGECQAIGVCNFNRKKLEELLRICRVKPTINQIERHPMFQQNEIVDFCEKNEILIMSYSPIARQNSVLMSNDVLSALAKKYGKTVSQIVLRWNVQNGHIPIPASSSENHIRENIDIFDFSLAQEEMHQIDELEAGMRVRFDPDKRFTWKQKIKMLICRIKLVFNLFI